MKKKKNSSSGSPQSSVSPTKPSTTFSSDGVKPDQHERERIFRIMLGIADEVGIANEELKMLENLDSQMIN